MKNTFVGIGSYLVYLARQLRKGFQKSIWLALALGFSTQSVYAIKTLQGIQIQKLGVSVSNLQLHATSLTVGQSISASYEFADTFSRDARDASIYLWGTKGTTVEKINSAGQLINQSGAVPTRTLTPSDSGTVLEVSVQARNTLGRKGNILTAATDSLQLGREGKIQDDNIEPSVSDLLIAGELSVGRILSASYQFNANTGEPTDKTTYQWGYKGYTANGLSNAASVQISGQVPNYTIRSNDAGQVLELSIQAKNGATPTRVGNILTVTTDGNGSGTNNTTGGNGGRVIDPNAIPSITNLTLSGTLQMGSTLNANYIFHANNGDPTDKTTYIWGTQNATAGVVETGRNVVNSGVVPPYTIQASDVGQILEVSVQAKNNAITPITGNILTAVVQETILAPLNATSLSHSLTIGQTHVDLSTITNTGGKAPYHYTISDAAQSALAANGLSLNAVTGKLTATTVMGIATPATDYTVIVTDSRVPSRNTTSATLTLVVNIAPVATQAIASLVQINGETVNLTPVIGSGGTRPLIYSISPSLENGLRFDTVTGAITGTVNGTPGETVYTVTVTDANGVSTNNSFSLTIGDTLTALPVIVSKALTATQTEINFTPITGSGGIGNLSYGISPALTNGLTLDTSTGAITGNVTGTLIPTIYTVTVSDSAKPIAHTASATFTLAVNAIPEATQAIASLVQMNGETVNLTPVIGSGGTRPLIYSISPALENGLRFDTVTGAITGTVNGTPGETVYTVTVTDANGVSTNNSFNLTISDTLTALPVIVSKALTATQTEINFTPITGSGGIGNLSYSISPALTNGLILDTSTGAITGNVTGTLIPTIYTVTVSDSAKPIAHTASATFTLAVNAIPEATQAIASLVQMNGDAVNITPVTGNGGTVPLIYSISPVLENGLRFNIVTGAITGTVNGAPGETVYTVTVIDANGVSANNSFSLTISDTLTALPVFASKALTATQTEINFTPITGSGGIGNLSYSISPALTNGLTLDASTGAITGNVTGTLIPTIYTVTVSDSAIPIAHTASATFKLTVNAAPSTKQMIASQIQVIGNTVKFIPVIGSDGTAPLSYSINPRLPKTVRLNFVTGEVLGIATEAISKTIYTVTVTDANGIKASGVFNLTVNGKLAATPVITNKALTRTQRGINFIPVTGNGGTGNLSYSISPALTNGLTLDISTGAITGNVTGTLIPTIYTVTVSDSAKPIAHTANATFNLTVNEIPSAVQNINAQIQNVGDTVDFTPVLGHHGTEPLSYSLSPKLPRILNINYTTGAIIGIATEALNQTTYTMTITDANGIKASNTFDLTVITP
ncbi:MAG: putative Ig domain-containing protein [Ottowia sp.]|nr:putative Ig domain-containing protein [Ottowia sp.]